MRDDIEDLFSRASADVAGQVARPAVGELISRARHRRTVKHTVVAAVTVMVMAGSGGWWVIGAADQVFQPAGPVGDLAPSVSTSSPTTKPEPPREPDASDSSQPKGEDPDDPLRHMPRTVPDAVWMTQDDLQRITPGSWPAYGTSSGITDDTPRCVRVMLEATLNGEVEYLHASLPGTGEVVIQYAAVLTTGDHFDGTLHSSMDACVDTSNAIVTPIGTTDGTVTSSSVIRVTDGDSAYLVATNETYNGITVTVYFGDSARVRATQPGDGQVKDTLAVAVGRIAQRGIAVADAYLENCQQAGECD